MAYSQEEIRRLLARGERCGCKLVRQQIGANVVSFLCVLSAQEVGAAIQDSSGDKRFACLNRRFGIHGFKGFVALTVLQKTPFAYRVVVRCDFRDGSGALPIVVKRFF